MDSAERNNLYCVRSHISGGCHGYKVSHAILSNIKENISERDLNARLNFPAGLSRSGRLLNGKARYTSNSRERLKNLSPSLPLSLMLASTLLCYCTQDLVSDQV